MTPKNTICLGFEKDAQEAAVRDYPHPLQVDALEVVGLGGAERNR